MPKGKVFMDIFNLIGSIFGYILWAAFYLVQNFGVAILIFTLITKIILFPFSVKQQRSMAANARFQKKQREIMERYGNDRVKANEEIQKVMLKENVSMTAGCLPMFAPFIVMFGVYYSVINPLTNTLHIASDKVATALSSLSTLPGLGTTINSQYGQISLVKYFNNIQGYLAGSDGSSLFDKTDVQKINEFGNGFNFLGWDLLASPSTCSFESMMWLIPVLCFVTSVASMFITQKLNGTQMKGCMAVMIFMMPLFSAWIAYNVPGAVGFYWISSTIFGFFQSLLLNKFYSASIIEAQAEAQRVVLRKQQESEVEFIDVPDYVAPSQQNRGNANSEKSGGRSSGKKQNKSKKSKTNNHSGSSYQGKKK